MRVKVERGAYLVPVVEGALLEARHQPHQVGERFGEGVAQRVRHLLVEKVQLGQVRKRHHVQLAKQYAITY